MPAADVRRPGPALLRLWMLLVLVVGTAMPATAQTGAIIEVQRTTAVLEQPRGDSVVIGSVQPGETFALLRTQGSWVLIAVPVERASQSSWRQGWITRAAILPATLPADAASPNQQASRTPSSARRPTMLRAFGQAGGVLFSARDSFEAIFGNSFGPMFGGGAQVVFSNGGFLQAGVEHFSSDGNRVMIGANELYALPTPVSVRVLPVQVSLGFFTGVPGERAGYAGGGFGIYSYREESPDIEEINLRKVGYHVLAGMEFPVVSGVSLAGEVQWTAVPKGLGDAGLSAAFDEDDLGGTTFKVKVIATF